MKTALEESATKQTSSAGRWWGYSIIYGKEDEHATPYMTRVWLGRLRIHAFHRGDQDPDCHDHPWDFWTFPLQPYVEEVATLIREAYTVEPPPERYQITRQIVPAWRWTFRPAEHTHRVVCRARMATIAEEEYLGLKDPIQGPDGHYYMPTPGTILTIVWRGHSRRQWGFLKERAGRWCRTFWKDYVYGGGKNAPCE